MSEETRKPAARGTRKRDGTSHQGKTRKDKRHEGRPRRMPVRGPGLPARKAAFHLLTDVLDHARPLDEAMVRSRVFAALEARDRAFVRLLVTTVLRRMGELDAAIGGFLDHPLPDKAAAARIILLLAAAQSLILKTPSHAAVHSAVELAAAWREAEPYKKLINAIARRLSEGGPKLLDGLDGPTLNTPSWLMVRWRRTYGADAAAAIAGAHMAAPPLHITVKRGPAHWAKRLRGEVLPTGSIVCAAGPVELMPGFGDGAWWVQDTAAAMPAKLLGDVNGQTVYDLCAAPGGKTAQLAAMGAAVSALDRSGPRLDRLRGNLARLALKATVIETDILDWRPSHPATHVLLDAPCSATGTIRRHPDVAHLKNAAGIVALAGLQAQMLDHVSDWLAPGGVLVYCVCSLEPEEGEAQVASLLERTPGLARSPVRASELGGLNECLTPEGDIRTMPCHLARRGGMDGFFISRLTRV